MDDLDWLRTEASRQGLELTDDDLSVIRDLVSRVKVALAEQRWPDASVSEPPYRYEAPRSRRR